MSSFEKPTIAASQPAVTHRPRGATCLHIIIHRLDSTGKKVLSLVEGLADDVTPGDAVVPPGPILVPWQSACRVIYLITERTKSVSQGEEEPRHGQDVGQGEITAASRITQASIASLPVAERCGGTTSDGAGVQREPETGSRISGPRDVVLSSR